MSTYPGGFDPAAFPEPFSIAYRTHLKHLKLKGLQPKTIDAYARAIRRMGEYFDFQIDHLTPEQLTDYFSQLIASHSWSAVKLDLYGLKFYTLHVLGKPWNMPNFIKPPKVSRLPDIVTVEEAQALFAATRTLSYRVFYFTLYSLGVLRRFWKTHHNPELLFPNRQGGLSGARSARTPLDRGGVQKTLHRVALACGLKKRSPRTACATAMPPT